MERKNPVVNHAHVRAQYDHNARENTALRPESDDAWLQTHDYQSCHDSHQLKSTVAHQTGTSLLGHKRGKRSDEAWCPPEELVSHIQSKLGLDSRRRLEYSQPPSAANSVQLDSLGLLRERIKDLWEELDDFHRHDYTLLRFLVARDLNVDKAELMLRNNIKWRKDNNIEQIMSVDISEDIVTRFPLKYSGYDAEGCPICFMPVGRYDYRHLVENKKTDEHFKFVLKTAELGYEIWKWKSTPDNFVHRTIAVIDQEGFSIKQAMFGGAMQYMKELMAVAEANYPETLKATIIVNAPRVMGVLFKIFKPLLTKAMVEKMQIYGPNADEWREAVRKLAPADQTPSQYGGANTTCFNYTFDMGFDISPKLVTLPEENMEQVTIPAGQKLDLDIQVPSKGTQLSWNFKSDSYDVGFYVYFDAAAPENEIVACPRCDSHINVQKGTFSCDKPGKYVLRLDNSYSKFRSKTLYYVTENLAPG